MIALRFRDFAGASQSLHVVLRDEDRPSRVEALLALGVAQRGLGRLAQAKDAFERAREAAPSDPRPLYNLGILYHEHVAPSRTEYDESAYRRAQEYFDRFAAAAEGRGAFAAAVADARARKQQIARLMADVHDIEDLARQAKAIEVLQTEQRAAEKERLLELEARLRAAQDAAR
jgi:tetratricopeptide (TPR) repeat protein